MATQYNQGQYSYRRRRRRGKPKRFSRKMCITVFLVFCVCLFTFGVLLFKIYRINSKDGDRYRKEALSQQSYTNTVLNYQRGDVKDRNNTTSVSYTHLDVYKRQTHSRSCGYVWWQEWFICICAIW